MWGVLNLFAWVAHAVAGARGAESGRAQPRPVTPEAPLLLQRRISIRRRRRLAERMAAVVRAITAGRRERARMARRRRARRCRRPGRTLQRDVEPHCVFARMWLW